MGGPGRRTALRKGDAKRRSAPRRDRPAGGAELLPDRAGDLRQPPRVRAPHRNRERLPDPGSPHERGCGAADRAGIGKLALRARVAGRRPPSPSRLRRLRQGRGLRGSRSRDGARPSRAPVRLRGRGPRRGAARLVWRLQARGPHSLASKQGRTRVMPDGVQPRVSARSRSTASHTIRRLPARPAGAAPEARLDESLDRKEGGVQMTPLGKSKHVAARMGRWSASHWKTATFGWLAFVVAAFAIGSVLGTKTLIAEKSGNGESGKAASIAYDQFRHTPEESVLIQSKTLTTGDTAFKAAVADAARRFAAKPYVKSVDSPYAPGNEGQISRDRHSALVTFKLRQKDLTKADKRVPALFATTAALQQAHPAVTLSEVGDASIDKQINDVFGQDLAKAGELSLPVTLLILLVAFGALVAAGIPLLLGLTSVFATVGLIAVASQWYPVDSNIFAVILLIGLPVGVDYSMFYVKREREERRAGKSPEAALEAAAATSGRSVLISGLTVMTAMAGMFFTGDKTFGGFAMGTIIVVATAVLGSLPVLPALLGRLGDKVEKGRIPYLGRLQQRSDGRVWGAIIDRVLRRPVVSAVASAAVLLAIAAPALGMKLVAPGADALPQNLSTIQTYNKVQKAFPGDLIPATVLLTADNVRTPQIQNSIRAMVGK